MENVEVRFFAAARAATKIEQIKVDSATLQEILATCIATYPELERVIPQCSFLIDGTVNHDPSLIIKGGSQVDVLPKFAGG
jgi:molybdopterin synthase sulfur carrier subunit